MNSFHLNFADAVIFCQSMYKLFSGHAYSSKELVREDSLFWTHL